MEGRSGSTRREVAGREQDAVGEEEFHGSI